VNGQRPRHSESLLFKIGLGRVLRIRVAAIQLARLAGNACGRCVSRFKVC
jgi:hypothetical protein